MKRKSLKFIACAAIMAMTLSVTACGGSDDAAPAAETEETTEAADVEAEVEEEPAEDTEAEADAETEAADEVEEETAEEADEAGTDAADASDVTVESLMNDPAVKEQYEEAFASYEEQGMTVAVEATGNELIMSLTITDSSLIQDGAAEQLETGLDAVASSFETLAGSLDQAVGADAGTCTYTVRYLDTDGSVLVERSFTAK